MIKFLLLFTFSLTAINAQVNSLCCIGEGGSHESMVKETAESDIEHCEHHEEKDSDKKSGHHCVLKCCSGALLYSSELKSEIIVSHRKIKNTFFFNDQKTNNFHIQILRPPIYFS